MLYSRKIIEIFPSLPKFHDNQIKELLIPYSAPNNNNLRSKKHDFSKYTYYIAYTTQKKTIYSIKKKSTIIKFLPSKLCVFEILKKIT